MKKILLLIMLWSSLTVMCQNPTLMANGIRVTNLTEKQPSDNYKIAVFDENNILKYYIDKNAAGGGGEGVSIHNQLLNIQGGTETERYHLTLAEKNKLVTEPQILVNGVTKSAGWPSIIYGIYVIPQYGFYPLIVNPGDYEIISARINNTDYTTAIKTQARIEGYQPSRNSWQDTTLSLEVKNPNTNETKVITESLPAWHSNPLGSVMVTRDTASESFNYNAPYSPNYVNDSNVQPNQEFTFISTEYTESFPKLTISVPSVMEIYDFRIGGVPYDVTLFFNTMISTSSSTPSRSYKSKDSILTSTKSNNIKITFKIRKP